MKGKEKAIYIIGAIVLVAVLYFGFDTKPSSHKALEKSRALSTREFDISSLDKEARPKLKAEDITYLETLETQLQHVREDSQKVEMQKQLSGFWFSHQEPVLAGLYAKSVAMVENTAVSWSITGTTFASALQQAGLEEKKKTFTRDEAIDAFEKAISLEPQVVDHRINQALCYIEAPLADTPMKGIQMLAELAKNYPESPLPPYHLARLANQTGQFQRAAERIEQAVRLDPQNVKIACLAAEIYKALQQADNEKKYAARCAGQQ